MSPRQEISKSTSRSRYDGDPQGEIRAIRQSIKRDARICRIACGAVFVLCLACALYDLRLGMRLNLGHNIVIPYLVAAALALYAFVKTRRDLRRDLDALKRRRPIGHS